MIYTVGLTHIYERQLDAGPVTKNGRGTHADGTPYPGGWVWRTREAAYDYLVQRKSEEIRSVYGVEADWETDTEPAPGEPFHYLLRNAKVVRIPENDA